MHQCSKQVQQPPETQTDVLNLDNYPLPKSQKEIQDFHISYFKSGAEVTWSGFTPDSENASV